MVSRRRGELTSSEIANATAQSVSRPASTVALRASWMPEARDVDPVAGVAARQPRVPLGLGGRQDRPRRGREDVAAGSEVTAVDVEHGLGRLVERPRAPQRRIGVAARQALHLGLDAPVEDHAAVGGEQRLDMPVAGRARPASARSTPSTSPAPARARPGGRTRSCAGTRGSDRRPRRASARSSRSLPKSSIANDAITDPYTAARRRQPSSNGSVVWLSR